MSEERPTAAGVPSPHTGGPVPITSLRPAIDEALQARDALVAALRLAGVALPSVDVRTPWPEEGRDALVHLGPCSARTAWMLATVIAKGVAR
ncbi:hypothetical protein ACFV0R_01355 [Streptomyces sp. NPDC059578]|uniref:hypothetical protein n=1 Tax=Streptomyces sp. NPDC059578 TaxID=3346874 RepID=UPI0036C32827